jgi:hypothetical protein
VLAEIGVPPRRARSILSALSGDDGRRTYLSASCNVTSDAALLELTTRQARALGHPKWTSGSRRKLRTFGARPHEVRLSTGVDVDSCSAPRANDAMGASRGKLTPA